MRLQSAAPESVQPDNAQKAEQVIRDGLNGQGIIAGMDHRSRLLARLFAVSGVLLVPWIVVLIEQLHGQAGRRSFDSSWVGLDVLEAVCLLTVARLLSRRHRATSPVAAATAAILCMDAWFDTMSSAPKLPYVESMAMACFAELPLAALLAWTSWRALDWAMPQAAAAPPPGAGDRSPHRSELRA
jgi:hypothetical protein